MNPDLVALKLYVDQSDVVWCLEGCGQPVCTGLSVIQFLLHTWSQQPAKYRLICTPQNLQLILALQLRESYQSDIEICSPLVCKTIQERAHPIRALYAMRQYTRPVSSGGWRQVTKLDCMNLALPAYMQKLSGQINDTTTLLLHKHPVWPALTFVPNLQANACISLLSLITDPRWFVDPIKPDRGSKLYKYLGLTPSALNGDPEKSVYRRRYNLVIEALGAMPDRINVERPGCFMWRVYRDVYERTQNESISLLRTTQKFVDFLRLCWLASLSELRTHDRLFVPGYFFKHEYEAKAFTKHLNNSVG